MIFNLLRYLKQASVWLSVVDYVKNLLLLFKNINYILEIGNLLAQKA